MAAREKTCPADRSSRVAEFFDIGQSRSIPWRRRPQAGRLLELLRDPDRGFDAIVIGEPQRAFYGNQFGLTIPVFVHYGVELWVPEVGGPIDPDSDAYDLIMSVFGGMPKANATASRSASAPPWRPTDVRQLEPRQTPLPVPLPRAVDS